MSDQPPDQPQPQDPLAEPRWQQPDQPQQPQPHPLPHPQPDWSPPQEPYASRWQSPVPAQPSAWGYGDPGGSRSGGQGGRRDRRVLISLAVGGVLLLAALAVTVGLLITPAKRPAKTAVPGPTPVTTGAERGPTTTSAESAPETTAATTPPAGDEVVKIGTAAFAEYPDGLRVQVTSVRRTTFSDLSTAPGPGVIATIKITNGSPARVDLELVIVALRYGPNGVQADMVFADNAHEFSGGLSRGRTATATYGFSVPRNQRDITVEVSPGFDYDGSTFEGRIT